MPINSPSLNLLEQHDDFLYRHIGPNKDEKEDMLARLGMKTLDELVDKAIPKDIRTSVEMKLENSRNETETLAKIRSLADQNKVFKSYIGTGYYNCITPPVILRNIMEDPAWYTAYTPYQAEISQGRLEGILNFQTMITDLTGMEIANGSMLDEATSAAEAMTMCYGQTRKKRKGSETFWVMNDSHPQTKEVLETRAEPVGIKVAFGALTDFQPTDDIFGILLQYPASTGSIGDYRAVIERAKEVGIMVVMAADLLSLVLMKSPGELGADVVVGASQRFGVPLGFGGPHAGYFATKDQYKRSVPGRIVGVSKDSAGKPALRLALQTREQHIRREKATSNICTSQVLLAVMAGMYAVYHGPRELRRIAGRVNRLASVLGQGLANMGHTLRDEAWFDTVAIEPVGLTHAQIRERAIGKGINLRYFNDSVICISLDETTTAADVDELFDLFATDGNAARVKDLANAVEDRVPADYCREGAILTHPVFNTHHSETEMLRYLNRLSNKDLSLAHSMIPLGSCTMKLNGTAEMMPVTWPEFGQIHPLAPKDQTEGYVALINELEHMLAEITGFPGISLQPNAGSQGEYAGLLTIRRYHDDRGDQERDVCIIPDSAHGTNPASAAMAGMKVKVVKCDHDGNIDLNFLREVAEANKDKLAALMVTYPSTHGVFEEGIREICEIIHQNGGQVYMDGANMNALVGLCRPGEFGPDVCHLNLHKTFAIPHGGGGPGVGPIGVAQHLIPYLPGHRARPDVFGDFKGTAVSQAPWGSAGILPISWFYISLMGKNGLKLATQTAILNANYIAKELEDHYPILYRGLNGLIAHECIIDLRPLKADTGVEVEDVAKRLMDYGFHAPTMSWPVAGTLMIEPTESESKEELDRFCAAMIEIRKEIQEIADGKADPANNVLKRAPHTTMDLADSDWDKNRAYSREKAVYPLPYLLESKFWPSVGRIDNAYGDKNLVCSCLPIEAYT